MSTKSLFVAAQDYLVFSRLVNSDPVVGERLSGVDFVSCVLRELTVEDEKKSCSFKDDDLVGFVLERDVGLRGP
jgi:hypothetical protein